jgi:hypothetical protein
MFLLDWLWSLLYKLGFFKKDATILLLGKLEPPLMPLPDINWKL